MRERVRASESVCACARVRDREQGGCGASETASRHNKSYASSVEVRTVLKLTPWVRGTNPSTVGRKKPVW